MKTIDKNGLSVDIFEAIEQTDLVCHGFSTRLGGVSQGELASLNLGWSRGDDPKHVEENYGRIGRVIGFDPRKTVMARQVHGTRIIKAEETMAGNQNAVAESREDGDGFITNVPGLVLTTFHADCVPLFFVDPVQKAIGLAHAGWRGTVAGIGKAVLDAMHTYYGTAPKDVICGIGPSIGPCCFQVGEEVAKAFRENWHFGEDYIHPDTAPEKYKVDLWGFHCRLLVNCGVPQEQIEITKNCTMCHPERYFSHRIQGEQRGSMAAFLMLR